MKVRPYLVMTDTDSGSLKLIVIAEDSRDCGEKEMRDVLLRIFLDNEIHLRLDLSSKFFDMFETRNKFCKRNKAIR